MSSQAGRSEPTDMVFSRNLFWCILRLLPAFDRITRRVSCTTLWHFAGCNIAKLSCTQYAFAPKWPNSKKTVMVQAVLDCPSMQKIPNIHCVMYWCRMSHLLQPHVHWSWNQPIPVITLSMHEITNNISVFVVSTNWYSPYIQPQEPWRCLCFWFYTAQTLAITK